MNACRVATSATSKRKNGIAIASVITPSAEQPQQDDEAAGHEQDQQVAGEDVGEQSHGQRDDPDEVRDDLDHEQRDGRATPVMPPGTNVFR